MIIVLDDRRYYRDKLGRFTSKEKDVPSRMRGAARSQYKLPPKEERVKFKPRHTEAILYAAIGAAIYAGFKLRTWEITRAPSRYGGRGEAIKAWVESKGLGRWSDVHGLHKSSIPSRIDTDAPILMARKSMSGRAALKRMGGEAGIRSTVGDATAAELVKWLGPPTNSQTPTVVRNALSSLPEGHVRGLKEIRVGDSGNKSFWKSDWHTALRDPHRAIVEGVLRRGGAARVDSAYSPVTRTAYLHQEPARFLPEEIIGKPQGTTAVDQQRWATNMMVHNNSKIAHNALTAVADHVFEKLSALDQRAVAAQFRSLRSAEHVSVAGLANSRAWFREVYSLYVTKPDILRERSPQTYALFRDIIFYGREYAQAATP